MFRETRALCTGVLTTVATAPFLSGPDMAMLREDLQLECACGADHVLGSGGLLAPGLDLCPQAAVMRAQVAPTSLRVRARFVRVAWLRRVFF